MTDSPQDDARIRATEARMRHALGLRDNTPSRSTADHPVTSANGSQPQRRRFVRDGEVPVTVIRRDHQPDAEHGINQLDAARQAIRSEQAAIYLATGQRHLGAATGKAGIVAPARRI